MGCVGGEPEAASDAAWTRPRNTEKERTKTATESLPSRFVEVVTRLLADIGVREAGTLIDCA